MARRSKNFWLIFSALACAVAFWLTGKIFFALPSHYELQLWDKYDLARTNYEASVKSRDPFRKIANTVLKDSPAFSEEARETMKLSDMVFRQDTADYDSVQEAFTQAELAVKPREKILSDFYLAAFFLAGVGAGLYAWFYFCRNPRLATGILAAGVLLIVFTALCSNRIGYHGYDIIGFLSGTIYFTPTLVGCRKRNHAAIFAMNTLLGWTFIGWAASLIWAITKDNGEK